MTIPNIKSKPTVSVIMPVYNGEKYLGNAILSILNQTYRNLELIIINDGSTDKSKLIINRFKQKDRRVKIIDLVRNKGISNALNCGIEAARGNYIARMDCDDISVPKRIEKQLLFFQQNKSQVDVCGTYFRLMNPAIGSEQKVIPAFADDFKNGRPPVHHPTCMIKRETFNKMGGYNTSYDDAEDIDLWFRWHANGVRFANIPEALYEKRIHAGSVSVLRVKRQVLLMLKINLKAIFKYRIRFSLRGYVRIIEQLLYYIYLSLKLTKIYSRSN